MTDSLTYCMDSGIEISRDETCGLALVGLLRRNLRLVTASQRPHHTPVADQVRHLTHGSRSSPQSRALYKSEECCVGDDSKPLACCRVPSCADRVRIEEGFSSKLDSLLLHGRRNCPTASVSSSAAQHNFVDRPHDPPRSQAR
jgi:hypothetical protein